VHCRSLALEPEVILLDEPTSGLDPISTNKVEATFEELKQRYTIILVPHSVQQAARTADFAAFFLQGELLSLDWVRSFSRISTPTSRLKIISKDGSALIAMGLLDM